MTEDGVSPLILHFVRLMLSMSQLPELSVAVKSFCVELTTYRDGETCLKGQSSMKSGEIMYSNEGMDKPKTTR